MEHLNGATGRSQQGAVEGEMMDPMAEIVVLIDPQFCHPKHALTDGLYKQSIRVRVENIHILDDQSSRDDDHFPVEEVRVIHTNVRCVHCTMAVSFEERKVCAACRVVICCASASSFTGQSIRPCVRNWQPATAKLRKVRCRKQRD